MIQVADNFNYRGKKPNFDRDSFDTLQDMKNYSGGLGRVYLRKNIVGDKNVLTQAMINKANIIYVIQHDYDLNGQTIVTPSNSILKFDGGSFDIGMALNGQMLQELLYNNKIIKI